MRKGSKMMNSIFMSISIYKQTFKNLFFIHTCKETDSQSSEFSLYSLGGIVLSNDFKHHQNAKSFSSHLSAKFHICISTACGNTLLGNSTLTLCSTRPNTNSQFSKPIGSFPNLRISVMTLKTNYTICIVSALQWVLTYSISSDSSSSSVR